MSPWLERRRSGRAGESMKIAIVIGSLGRGGSERQIVNFVQAAHPDHADVVVVCLQEEGELAGEVRAVGARVLALGFNGVHASSLPALLSLRFLLILRLLLILRAERPDVVYAFLFWGYALALPASAIAAPWAVRVAARRSFPEFDKPAHPFLRPLRGLADRLADAVVANSDQVRTAWARAAPVLAPKIRVIPNGLPMAPSAELGRPRQNEQPVVVCVANLIAYKGHKTLLEAAEELTRRTRDWSLLLIGDGPERDWIEHEIERRRLTGVVTLLGRRTDVGSLLDRADVAVLPSYTEGLPNAVLEAMAHGVPVVATDVGGTSSLLSTGAGILVPPRDANALATALRAMLQDPQLRTRAGREGKAVVATRYTVGRMRDQTLSLFRELVRTRR
jgi:glycosyltransferase involved in cell wall biosynthesis